MERMKEIKGRIFSIREQMKASSPMDAAYIRLNQELAKWEKSYPEFILDDTPAEKDMRRFTGEMIYSENKPPFLIQEQEVLLNELTSINEPVIMQLLPKGIEAELHYEQGCFQYACMADELMGVKEITSQLALSFDVPRFIAFEEPLSVKGCLFFTASFQEKHPEADLLNAESNREIRQNRRLMVKWGHSACVELPFLRKLGFLVPYHRVYTIDTFQEIIPECEALLAYDTGYEIEGVLLQTGGKELLYNPFLGKSRLDGKTVVITGVLSKRRYDFRKDIEALGGTLAGTVTKTVDFLLMGKNGVGTTKYQKAIKLGIPIMTEEQFKETFCVE